MEDRAAVAAEEKLDGKFLLRTSDPTLSAEEVALGYKQLLKVERAWRDMKTTLNLRPVYHRRQERIRAHVLLCWLGLLLIRIAENGTGQTWHRIRWELEKMHLGRFSGRTGLVQQRTESTPPPSGPSSGRSAWTNRPASSTSNPRTRPRPPELRPRLPPRPRYTREF